MSEPSPQEKLAELERIGREQDARSARHELEHTRRLIGVAGEIESRRLSDTLALQIRALADRLVELCLLDYDDPDEEIELGTIASLESGEIVPAIRVRAFTYSAPGAALIVQRDHGGHVEYAEVDANGEFGQWKLAPPPPSTRQAN